MKSKLNRIDYAQLIKLADNDDVLKAILKHRAAYMEWYHRQLPGAGKGMEIKELDQKEEVR